MYTVQAKNKHKVEWDCHKQVVQGEQQVVVIPGGAKLLDQMLGV